MALASAIEFQNLASQLTDSETASFVNNLATSQPMIIIQALSSYFIHQSSTQKAVESYNTDCNETISSIIRSRDGDNEVPHEIVFDALPRRIIGVCGSFLDQECFAALSRCNRAIYLGCCTPIVLEEIQTFCDWSSAKLPLDFSKYSFSNHLSIIRTGDIDQESDLDDEARWLFRIWKSKPEEIAVRISKMPRLRSLAMRNIHPDFIKMIASQEITNQNVKSLKVEYFDYHEMSNAIYIESLTSFKHLQYLELTGEPYSWIMSDFDIRAMTETFNNLKGLIIGDWNSSSVAVPLLTANRHSLQFLRVYCIDQAARMRLKDIKFENLRQLQFGYGFESPCKFLRTVMKSSKHLEKVQFQDGIGEIHEASKVMGELFRKCTYLCYLEISDKEKSITDILEVIESALYQTREQHRKRLKLKIDAADSWRYELSKLHANSTLNLDRIIKVLTNSAVENWMILLQIDRERANTSSLSKNPNAQIVKEKYIHANRMIVTNSDCNICGYRESWLM